MNRISNFLVEISLLLSRKAKTREPAKGRTGKCMIGIDICRMRFPIVLVSTRVRLDSSGDPDHRRLSLRYAAEHASANATQHCGPERPGFRLFQQLNRNPVNVRLDLSPERRASRASAGSNHIGTHAVFRQHFQIITDLEGHAFQHRPRERGTIMILRNAEERGPRPNVIRASRRRIAFSALIWSLN